MSESLQPKASRTNPATVRITLVKSPIGFSKRHKATVRALGFRRLHQTIEHVDTPTLRGMLYQVNHLITIETVVEPVEFVGEEG